MRDRPFQVSDSGDGAKTSEQEISARGWGVGREGFNSSLPLPFFRFAFFPSLFISCPFQLSDCLKKASLCCILKHRTAATFTIKHGRCAVTKRLSLIKVALSPKTQKLTFLWLAPWWKIREICTRRFLHFVIIIDDRSFYVNPIISDDQLFKFSWFPTPIDIYQGFMWLPPSLFRFQSSHYSSWMASEETCLRNVYYWCQVSAVQCTAIYPA